MSGLGPLAILWWIIGAGAFGGFVDGLIVKRSYALRWKATTIDIGSLGDVLVGAAASIAIFTVATSVFTLKFEELNKTEVFIKVVAWGVLSGFAGLRILQGMSEKLVKDIATKTAEDAVKKAVVEDLESDIALNEANAALTRYDMAKDSGWLPGREDEARRFLDAASSKFDAVLERQADNDHALRGKARLYRRLAELAKSKGDSKAEKENWDKAIGLLSRSIGKNPNASLAYYNLACYKQLMGGELADVCGDLRKAIEISSSLKSNARSDPDFAGISNQAAFKELVK